MNTIRPIYLRTRLSVLFQVTFLLCTLFINQTSRAQGPCNAHRYLDGDGWRYNTTTNKWEAQGPVNGQDLPLGIVTCGSSASTENGLEGYQHPYDPDLFTVSPSCFAGPVSGQYIIWFNFDIRPFAGTFQFQLESSGGGGQGVHWAAYYVDAAHSGPPATNTSTGTYPEFVSDADNSKNLSGDCANQTLTYATCGTSFTGWATLTVPSFAKPTNYYLAIWSDDGEYISTNVIFKSRFGCGGATCDLEKSGSSSFTCNSNTTYTVCQDFLGSQGKWQVVDNAAIAASSYSVSLFKSDGTPVGSTTTSNTPPSFILGVVPDGAVKATICATYGLGQPYDISLQPDPTYSPNIGGGVDYITCTSSGSFSGTGPDAVTANAGDDFTKTCKDYPDGKQIGETSANGYTYSWTPATGLDDPNVSNPTANPDITTTYTVTKTSTVTGCSDTAKVVVTVNNAPVTANAGDDFTKTCKDYPNGKQIGEPSADGFTYSWTPVTGLDDPNVSDPTANPNVTTTYTVTKTYTATGCSDTDKVVVTVNNATVTANAGYDFTKTCIAYVNGKQIGEPSADGFTYAWIPATGLSATNISNPIANPSVTTTYTVVKTNTATGCSDDDQVVVTVYKVNVVANAGYDFTKTCTSYPNGKQIGEPSATGYTYLWSPATGLSATNVSNPTANPSVTTTYTVVKTHIATGCSDDDVVVVTVNKSAPAKPVITVTQPTCNNPSGIVKVTSPVGSDYEYSNNGGPYQTSPIFSVPANTNYSITVKKISTGCVSTACTGKMGPKPTCLYYTYTDKYCSTTGTFCIPGGSVKGGSSLIRRALDNMDGVLGNNSGQLYLGKPGASFTATILDSARLSAILPGTGTATKLLNNYNLNSTYPPLTSGKVSNVLLSHAIILALNVKIPGNTLGSFLLKDNYLTTITGLTGCNAGAATCSNGGIISSLKITTNATLMNLLRNQTVDSLIRMASKALGGTLPASVTYSDISNALGVINSSFDGGRYFMGYYTTQQSCTPLTAAKVKVGDDQVPAITSNAIDVKAYPNPFEDKVKFSMTSGISGDASLDIYDVLGQKLGNVYKGYLFAGRTVTADYRVPSVAGSLIYTLKVGDQTVTGKLIRAK